MNTTQQRRSLDAQGPCFIQQAETDHKHNDQPTDLPHSPALFNICANARERVANEPRFLYMSKEV